MRPNPKKLNALQLRTLAILQTIARQPDLADPPEQDGTVDDFRRCRMGTAITCTSARRWSRRATPADWAIRTCSTHWRAKACCATGSAGLPSLTLEGRNYHTGIDTTLLHGADH